MSNFTFPCSTVNGLTTNQKREAIKALRESIKGDTFQRKVELIAKKNAKAKEKESKIASAIAKAEARLQKLLSKQVGAVGAKAIKAAKRPSKAITVKV
jgi:hypothetical protein